MERRLQPQITTGVLADASGLPLLVKASEGNKAETNMLGILPPHARALVTPGRCPACTSARCCQRRRDSAATPSLDATALIASYSDSWFSRDPTSSRNARCRNSGGS